MRWKWILGIAAVLIIALIVTVYVILSRYDYNSLKPLMARTAKDATGRELTLGGDIKLKVGLSPTLLAEDVSLQNVSWGSRPEMVKVKRLEIQVALLPLIRWHIKVKRLILVAPDILIETDGSGKTNLDFTPAKIAEPKKKNASESVKLPALSLTEVRLGKGRLTYKDGKSGKTYLLVGKSLTASAESFGKPLQFEFQGAYNENPIEASGKLGALDSLTKPNKPWSLDLTAAIAEATVKLDGSLRDVMSVKGIDFAVDIAGNSMQQVAKIIDLGDLPEIGPFKVGFKFSDPAPSIYKINDLNVTFGKSDLGGSAEINLSRKRPNLAAELVSNNLDLRPLLSNGEPEVKSKRPSPKQKQRVDKVFPNDPLPLKDLREIDASVKLKSKRILLPRLAMDNAAVDLVLADGRLALNPIKATTGGGNMHGRFELNPSADGAEITAAVKIEHLDLGPMLKKLDLSDITEGQLDLVDIELEGGGGSIAELMAGLNGRVVIQLGEAKIRNKYIDIIGGSLAPNLFRITNPLEQRGKYTIGNCLVCRTDIEEGIANITVLVFDTQTVSVVAGGKVDLKTEVLDVSFKPYPKEGTGNFSLSMGELSQAMKLGGTLAAPSMVVSPIGGMLTLGKAAGGIALLGPLGVAAAFVGERASVENPCLAAIEAAEKEVPGTKGKKPNKKGDTVTETKKK